MTDNSKTLPTSIFLDDKYSSPDGISTEIFFYMSDTEKWEKQSTISACSWRTTGASIKNPRGLTSGLIVSQVFNDGSFKNLQTRLGYIVAIKLVPKGKPELIRFSLNSAPSFEAGLGVDDLVMEARLQWAGQVNLGQVNNDTRD